MMLWSPELAVVPVTIHLPLREIFKHLSTDLVVETGRIVARDLATRFRIAHPRLAIAGLNPHAGESGYARRGGSRDRRTGGRAPCRRGHRCQGTASGRFAVPRARARDLRRGSVHVSRSGADPDQDARLRPRRQRHARPSVRAHFARSRHRLRHRRHRHAPIRQVWLRRCGWRRGSRWRTARRSASPRRDRRAGWPAAVARGHSPHGLIARKSLGQNFLLRSQSRRAHRPRGGSRSRA